MTPLTFEKLYGDVFSVGNGFYIAALSSARGRVSRSFSFLTPPDSQREKVIEQARRIAAAFDADIEWIYGDNAGDATEEMEAQK